MDAQVGHSCLPSKPLHVPVWTEFLPFAFNDDELFSVRTPILKLILPRCQREPVLKVGRAFLVFFFYGEGPQCAISLDDIITEEVTAPASRTVVVPRSFTRFRAFGQCLPPFGVIRTLSP